MTEEQEFQRFSELYWKSASQDNGERVESRMQMPPLVEKLGKEKCDRFMVRINDELEHMIGGSE